MSHTRTILITGGTSGVGYACAAHLAQQHPEYLIIIAARKNDNSAAESINTKLKQTNVQYLPLDLSSFTNIRTFAKDWETKNYPPIQALLLNAALQWPRKLHKTEDGIESTFGIAHVGNALLFFLLFHHLSHNARIIITSSGTHDPAQKTGLPDAKYDTAEELAHPSGKPSALASGMQRYASAKLANVMFTYALHRRCISLKEKDAGKTLTVVAFDPGLMPGTGLARGAPFPIRWMWNHVVPHALPVVRRLMGPYVLTPQESGGNMAWLAVSPETEGVSGVYFQRREAIKSSVDSYDEKKQEDLWEWTVKTCASNEEERNRFDIAK
jgi:NAD(P)-dependent dehydrogenase (short-subunit alcohol dehydrogenase family)